MIRFIESKKVINIILNFFECFSSPVNKIATKKGIKEYNGKRYLGDLSTALEENKKRENNTIICIKKRMIPDFLYESVKFMKIRYILFCSLK